jgi:hypothetical protein
MIRRSWKDRTRKALLGIEAFLGVSAVGGGLALAAAPDGRLLAADPSVFAQSPFADFLFPGILLAVFVGWGGLLGAALTLLQAPYWKAYACAYALGVMTFETIEYLLIGFQVLQAFEAALASAMVVLVLTVTRQRPAAQLGVPHGPARGPALQETRMRR